MVNAAVDRARRHSSYLRLQLDKNADIEAALRAGSLAEALSRARDRGGGESAEVALRRERNATALVLGIGDLAGALSLQQVVEELSDLADRALDRALAAAIEARTPGEAPRGFAIIALGKHGSRELNYSSDIDLLYLYDPAQLPLRPREEPMQAALRIGGKVTELLQARTADGYAFRVDLRLRPSPEVTPIALPVDAAISYYESSALPWERAAFIRARAAAGDRALGRYFLESIHPFVWRRSLDFGAVSEIRSITGRIRDHYAQGQAFGPGFDLKRGRGGIREVEFFAQIHQLIHGGRDPALQVPATLPSLAALAEAGRIPVREAEVLGAAYRLFRTIEHRLQMVDDRQTHSLPVDRERLDNVAQLHGLESADDLLGLLEPHVREVTAIYGALGQDVEESERLPAADEALDARLAASGFTEPATARMRIEGWRARRPRSLRSEEALGAFEAMLPQLIDAFGRSPDPMRALNRFDDVVEKLPSGVNFYRLLQAQPALTEVLATVLAHAPALAEQLGRRPELLDGLIDASAFEPPPPLDELAAYLARPERRDEDYQMLLDRVRRRVNEYRFALGTQLIVGRTDPVDVGEGYSRVAEAAIQVLADAAIAEFEKVHGRVPGSELLVLAFGRLGGASLTHASDLDLVYLFRGTRDAESDGRKPLRATDYFNRLCQRVTASLSVPTAAGPLYQVDTRLRPSGNEGLLCVSTESFEQYQREEAWTWEHMALTRARPVYGSPEARAELQAIVDGVLRMPRDSVQVAQEALRMRGEIARHKPAAGLFDVKLSEGGWVDLQFAVNTLQLQHCVGLSPRLEVALEELAAAGLAPDGMVEHLSLLTRLLVTLRLVSPASTEPPEESRELVARACGHESWPALLAAYETARQRVREFWLSVSGAKEE